MAEIREKLLSALDDLSFDELSDGCLVDLLIDRMRAMAIEHAGDRARWADEETRFLRTIQEVDRVREAVEQVDNGVYRYTWPDDDGHAICVHMRGGRINMVTVLREKDGFHFACAPITMTLPGGR